MRNVSLTSETSERPAPRLPADRERRVESRQTTGCFCDQGSSWKFKHIYIPRVRGAVAGQVDMKPELPVDTL